MTFASGLPMARSADMSRTTRRVLAVLVACLWPVADAAAEPYIAMQQGLQCATCHSHPGGGGLRNAYGNVYAQSALPAERVGGDDQAFWNGEVLQWLSVGADLRGAYEYVDTPNQPEQSEFDISRATVYLQANLVPGRLSLYVDQQVAPGGSLNREAYARLNSASGQWSLIAGQFYLPYGWRLQDDTAFVRQVTGVNFTNPDRGVQLAWSSGAWSAIGSLTNGTGGAAEIDTGKQLSIVTTYVQPRWRAGASINVNDADAGDRSMANVFGGIKTGPVVWLAEVDWIEDDLPGGTTRNSLVSLIEANWHIRRGHNLKFSHDWFDPDDDIDENEQARFNLVWEYTPMQFLQARFGIRVYDGIPQVDAQNREVLFAELHAFF